MLKKKSLKFCLNKKHLLTLHHDGTELQIQAIREQTHETVVTARDNGYRRVEPRGGSVSQTLSFVQKEPIMCAYAETHSETRQKQLTMGDDGFAKSAGNLPEGGCCI